MFPLYTSTVRGDDKAGDVLTVAPEQLLQLPPLHTVLRGGKRSGDEARPGDAGRTFTAIGTLEAVLRREGRQQPLAAGIQRPRSGQGDAVEEAKPTRRAKAHAHRRVARKRRCRRRPRLIRGVYHPPPNRPAANHAHRRS